MTEVRDATPRWRQVLAVAAFAAILFGGFQTFYLRVLTFDRAAFGRAVAEAQYRKAPGLRTFMLGVRERTRPGDTIALFFPARSFWEGYAYGYSRSVYHLAGRNPVPLLDQTTNRFMSENLARANHVVAWQVAPPFPGFEIVWRDGHGVLMRRVR